ncbi:hypothetical protein E0L36_26610 [Streptomyces sp. AJS327]|nr:hypothetical protein [Streptomyces sp. AJS327]
MSLIRRGPDEVTVYPTVQVDDGYGGTQPGPGEPVTIQALVLPSSADESGAEGYLVGTEYRVYARTLPAGPWSRVDWAGKTWAVVGDPQRFGASRATRHDVAVIRKRG